MTTSNERVLHPQLTRHASPVAVLIVVLFLQGSLPLASGQACESAEIQVANTNFHRSREGIYYPVPAKRCSGRPVWVQQTTDPISANYIYYRSLTSGVPGWLIGMELCSKQGGLFGAASTKCPCGRRWDGIWMEALENGWISNPRITVKCKSEVVPSSADADASETAMGIVAGIIIFVILVVVIVCCCMVAKKKSQSRSNNRIADVELNMSQINTVSEQVAGTNRNVLHPVELIHPVPYSHGIPLPPRYSLLNIQSLASAPPYDEASPPTYQDVIGTQGVTGVCTQGVTGVSTQGVTGVSAQSVMGARTQEVVAPTRHDFEGPSSQDINIRAVRDNNGKVASDIDRRNREESSGHQSPFIEDDLAIRQMEHQFSRSGQETNVH